MRVAGAGAASNSSRSSISTGALSRRALARTMSLSTRRAPFRRLRPEGILVVTGETRHHLLEVEAQVVAALVDRQVLGLRHNSRRLGGQAPQTPHQMIQMTQ
jgi:hypothetical protein